MNLREKLSLIMVLAFLSVLPYAQPGTPLIILAVATLLASFAFVIEGEIQ
jgi:hypothetical protein